MVDQNTTTQDTPDNIVALRTRQFSDEQALAWLRERGRITAPASDLARVWGWHERRARRKLDSWKHAGLIRRKGKLTTVVAAKSDAPIFAKRTANGQAKAEQADADPATSDTNAALKSDTPILLNRKVAKRRHVGVRRVRGHWRLSGLSVELRLRCCKQRRKGAQEHKLRSTSLSRDTDVKTSGVL